MTRRSWLLMGGSLLVSKALPKTLFTFVPVPGATFVLEVEKTGLMAGKKHHFLFTDYHGEVTDEIQNSGGKRVVFSVRSSQIQCEDTWVSEKDREKILKYALGDMLRVDKYPEIHYVSSSIRERGNDSYSIEGMLTIRTRTRPVAVTAIREIDGAGRPWWNGSATLSLRDFDLKAPSAAMGLIGTRDKMQLSFHLTS